MFKKRVSNEQKLRKLFWNILVVSGERFLPLQWRRLPQLFLKERTWFLSFYFRQDSTLKAFSEITMDVWLKHLCTSHN
jgi:hypothetical protein